MDISLGDILYTIDGLSPLDEAPTYIQSELTKLSKEVGKIEYEIRKEVDAGMAELQDKIDSLEAEVERLNSELATYQYLFPSHGQS